MKLWHKEDPYIRIVAEGCVSLWDIKPQIQYQGVVEFRIQTNLPLDFLGYIKSNGKVHSLTGFNDGMNLGHFVRQLNTFKFADTKEEAKDELQTYIDQVKNFLITQGDVEFIDFGVIAEAKKEP